MGRSVAVEARSMARREDGARSTLVDAGESSNSFLPYGTPCSEVYDPANQKLELLQCEVEQLRKQAAD